MTICNRINLYIGKLVWEFPSALIEAWKLHGVKGVYLAICEFVLCGVPFPVRLGRWGILRTRHELCNYFDNFVFHGLCCDEVEESIRRAAAPTIIDLGINTGVTVRRWISLNPSSTVVGIDMIQEALAFTTSALRECDHTGRWIPICCGVGAREESKIEISVSDPLEGTTSISSPVGAEKRAIRMNTLDNLLAPLALKHVNLLKCDIEGSGGFALLGASEMLKTVDYVVVETHDAEETMLMSKALRSAGFALFKAHAKMQWWKRTGLPDTHVAEHEPAVTNSQAGTQAQLDG
jgi:FkbM family methyltransferase